MRFQPGDISTCSDCKREIVFVDPYWKHTGPFSPRHIARPIELQRPTEVTVFNPGIDPFDPERVGFRRRGPGVQREYWPANEGRGLNFLIEFEFAGERQWEIHTSAGWFFLPANLPHNVILAVLRVNGWEAT